MTTSSNSPLLSSMKGWGNVMDIEACRKGVNEAAAAKVSSGRSISIRQCLLDAGFCESQASNKTMQMRVRRQVQKLQGGSRPKRRRINQFVPTAVYFSTLDEDLVSVLSDFSTGGAPPVQQGSATPAEVVIPTSIFIPPPVAPVVSASSSPLLLLQQEDLQLRQQQNNHDILRSSPNLFATVAASQLVASSTLEPPILPISNTLAEITGNLLHPTKRRLLELTSYPLPGPPNKRRREDDLAEMAPPTFAALCR